MTLNIEINKFYRTQDGRKVGPWHRWREYYSAELDGDDRLWNEDGIHGTRNIANRPEYDLIAEWVDEPKVGTLAELELKEGDVVACESVSSWGETLFTAGKQYTAEIGESGNAGIRYDDGKGIALGSLSTFRLISRAADAKPDSFLAMLEPQADETPLDHFDDQPTAANDNDERPLTSKDAYAEIAEQLGFAVRTALEIGEYEDAMRLAALMRKAELAPVELMKVELPMRNDQLDASRWILGVTARRKFSGDAAMSKDDFAWSASSP